MCKECKLSTDDLEHMTIGNAIDYIDEYISMKDPNNKNKNSGVREATQVDFDNF